MVALTYQVPAVSRIIRTENYISFKMCPDREYLEIDDITPT